MVVAQPELQGDVSKADAIGEVETAMVGLEAAHEGGCRTLGVGANHRQRIVEVEDPRIVVDRLEVAKLEAPLEGVTGSGEPAPVLTQAGDQEVPPVVDVELRVVLQLDPAAHAVHAAA